MLHLTLEQRVYDWTKVEGLSFAIFYFLLSPNAHAIRKICLPLSLVLRSSLQEKERISLPKMTVWTVSSSSYQVELQVLQGSRQLQV